MVGGAHPMKTIARRKFTRFTIEPLEARIAPAFVSGAVLLADLNTKTGSAFHGAAPGDYAGKSVSAAGDVNGDGFGDFIVGASRVAVAVGNSGAAYVILGKAGGFAAQVSLGSLNAARKNHFCTSENGLWTPGNRLRPRKGQSRTPAVRKDITLSTVAARAFSTDPRPHSGSTAWATTAWASGARRGSSWRGERNQT
jgi:hypothetical protein